MPTALDALHRGLSSNRAWGRTEITPVPLLEMQRRGAVTVRVYPPGATKSERVALRLRYASTSLIACSLGAALVLAALVLGSLLVAAGAAFAVLVAWVCLRAVTESLVARVRYIRFPLRVRSVGKGRAVVHLAAGADRFDVLMDHLHDLDRDAARLGPVDYEHRWGLVYEQLPEAAR